ncbi:MAG: tyrosine-type recombinase/integrase [Magnetococcales bacterium]|nr:tyrosine-type recombinase/integrase [Magnetococcales bacterium]
MADSCGVQVGGGGAVAVPAPWQSWWERARLAYAPESVRALEGDLKAWAVWCQAAGVDPWPITADALLGWLDGYVGAVASLRRRLASLRILARASGGADPTKEERVRLAAKAAFRRLAAPQGQAQAWTWGSTRAETSEELRGRESHLVRVRDQALVRVAYDTLARSSEVRALRVEDLSEQPDGTGVILLKKTKTDQERRGSWRYLSADTMRAVRAWVRQSGVKSWLFCGVDQGVYPVTDKPLSAIGAWRVYQRMGARIGGDYSPHSTRVGAACDMVAGGIELPAIMQAGGWRSPEMVARYSARLATASGAAATLAKLQNR